MQKIRNDISINFKYDGHGILETHIFLTEDCILEPGDEWAVKKHLEIDGYLPWSNIDAYKIMSGKRIKNTSYNKNFCFRRKIKYK